MAMVGNMNQELVRLSDDGELVPEEALTTAQRKPKELRPNPPRIQLWERPYPDPAGYTSVHLYTDIHLDGWYYKVLCEKLHLNGRVSGKVLDGGAYETMEAAQQAGLDKYHQHVAERKAALEEPMTVQDWLVLAAAIACLIGLAALIGVAIFKLVIEPLAISSGVLPIPR
jgi:hypothetical protein